MKSRLFQLLGLQPPKLSEHEMVARTTARSLTLIGFEAYDVWIIAEHLLELSLNAQEHPNLFPPNQRTSRKRYPQV